MRWHNWLLVVGSVIAACTNHGCGGCDQLVRDCACDEQPLETGDLSGVSEDMRGDQIDMRPSGAPTGASCTYDYDCASGLGPDQVGHCIPAAAASDASTQAGGYCSSPCRTARTAATGANPDCPSTAATCLDYGYPNLSLAQGTCVELCSAGDGGNSCHQSDYACAWVNWYAQGCLPSALLPDGGEDGGPVDAAASGG
jgi:hypothetical protein